MIISWDNLSSKGIVNGDHDYVLVWNRMMFNEYKRFYSLFDPVGPQVCITGIPRFDIYFKELPEEYSILQFRKRYTISPSDRVILFTTSAISHFPNQADIVKHLLEYTTRKENVKIIVRCHAGDNFGLYKRFAHEGNLRTWYPYDNQDKSAISNRMPDLNMLNSLAEMLEYCDVCINVASTIRLEAAICNKPNISIAYDGELNPPFHSSVKRFYNYSHQIPLNRLEIDRMVFSKNELFEMLDNLLYHCPRLKNSNNSEKIQDFTGHSGPFGVSVTMKYIRQWLN
jgi:CDP-glycerol glycerophosphotransferase (TagB/SpsB family)